MPNPTIVLTHGAWHGPWVWDQLRRKLPDLDTRTVDLASSGSDPDRLGDLYDDAEILRTAVAEVDGPVVVVAHSYGSMVATEALTDVPNVQQVVYLAAFVPDEGESIDSLHGHQFPNWVTVHDGYIDAGHPTRVFYGDCSPRQAAWAARQLTHQSVSSVRTPVTDPAWRYLPTTYLLTTRDRAIHPAAQAVMSARCDQVHRLRSDHSPMLSQPDALADLLRSVIVCDANGPYRPYRG
ncbi:MAG: alpha/beta fold hydrolase [Actinophytocola sp.]|uniref:alpha/beta hydrolase n=1 Tax=Actinophytocola sp. TaxID=1872138 RepID=UPI001329916C|nr:alpha/beta hydrolase [Actinophytocola sp.]MPZ84013.1 alpha/beta fold hydrolase [Actinophytocola sp.]